MADEGDCRQIDLVKIMDLLMPEKYYCTNFKLNIYQKIPYLFMKIKNRCIINYGTGTGKTITAILIFFDHLLNIYRINKNMIYPKRILIVGNFTTKDSIKSDLANKIFKLQLDYMNRETVYINKNSIKSKPLFPNDNDVSRKYFNHIDVIGYFALFNLLFIGDMAHIDKNQEFVEAQVEQGKLEFNLNAIEQLRDSIIVIDEVQNLYSRNGLNSYGVAVSKINKFLDEYNIKLVLLSATMFNASTSEFLFLAKIIQTSSINFSTEEFLYKTDRGQLELKQEKFHLVVDELKDKLFYYKMDENLENFPVIYQTGNLVMETDNFFVDDIIYQGLDKLVLMCLRPKGYQESMLTKYENNENLIEKLDADPADPNETIDSVDSLDMMNRAYIMTPPQNNNTDSHYKVKTVYKGAILKKETIGNYSILFEYIISHLLSCIKNKEKTVVYNEDITHFGIYQMLALLDMNGFKYYHNHINPDTLCWNCGRPYNECSKDPSCKFSPCNYAFITGVQTEDEKFNIIDIYKAPENLFGHSIAVLFISKAAYAGLNIPHTNHLLITSPVPNINSWKQIIGRVNRYKSHTFLPLNKRFVKVQTIVIVNTPIEQQNYANLKKNKFILGYYNKYMAYQSINEYYGNMLKECYYTFESNDPRYNNFNLLFTQLYNGKQISKILLENYVKLHIDNYILNLISTNTLNMLTNECNTANHHFNYFKTLCDYILPIEEIEKYYTKSEIQTFYSIVTQGIFQYLIRYNVNSDFILNEAMANLQSNGNHLMPTIFFSPVDIIQFMRKRVPPDFPAIDIDSFRINVNNITSNLMELFYIIKSIISDKRANWSKFEENKEIKRFLFECNGAYLYDDEMSPEKFIENHALCDNFHEAEEKIFGVYFGNTIYKFNGDTVRVDKRRTLKLKPFANNYQLIINTGTDAKNNWPLRLMIREIQTEEFIDKRRITTGKSCAICTPYELAELFGEFEETNQKKCFTLIRELVKKQYTDGLEKRWITTPFEACEK